MATTAAEHEVDEEQATLTSATVVLNSGTVTRSNTGHPCTSGHLLQVKLIGDFPHIVTTGDVVPGASPQPDFTGRAVLLTLDAGSGEVCLIGVQVGTPTPEPGATVLHLS